MKKTPQNPKYHAEGNVYNHTMLVFEAVMQYVNEQTFSEQEKKNFLNAALLHDVGKPGVTTLRNGNWSARGHEEAGVSIAREILLQYPEISTEERIKILDIVRWHHIPLRWITGEMTYNQLLSLSTRVDFSIMGQFSLSDFRGRICQDKALLLTQNTTFLKEIVPQIQAHSQPYEMALSTYQRASITHKNAFWKAYLLRQPQLWQKLLLAPSAKYAPIKNPDFRVIMTIGTPKSGKTTFLQQQYPYALHISLAAWELDGPLPLDTFVRQRIITAFQYHISVYSRHHRQIVLEGNNLNEETRQLVSDIIKGLNGELTYLFFETSLQKCLEYNAASENSLKPEIIEQAYKKLLYPHPWEAHRLIFAEK
ncbi:MAG: HD domain-containing protein [Bacteroidia bacterium]